MSVVLEPPPASPPRVNMSPSVIAAAVVPAESESARQLREAREQLEKQDADLARVREELAVKGRDAARGAPSARGRGRGAAASSSSTPRGRGRRS